jgi:sporulation protein YlmC with PRC-barrel domain
MIRELSIFDIFLSSAYALGVMRINSKQLTNLPVITKSGQDLGKVGNFDIDSDSGRLMTIHVKTRGLVKGLLDTDLLVDWSQIVTIDEDKVVVSDASVPGGVKALASQTAGSASASGALLAKGDIGEEN